VLPISTHFSNLQAGAGYTVGRSLGLVRDYEAQLTALKAVSSAEDAAELLRGRPCPVLVPLCELVLECMRTDPAARPTAAEVVERLEGLEGTLKGVSA